MKRKKRSTPSTPHVQEQCGVWLSAKGRNNLQEGSTNQRILPCITTPRQSRVVLGELVIPQPRPRIGGKQSTLTMFFKPFPVSPSSATSVLKCNGKENSILQEKEISKNNQTAFPTEPLVESRCKDPEMIASNDFEGSSGFQENNTSDSDVHSEECTENEIDGLTGCTLNMDSLNASDKEFSSKDNDSDELSLGKSSYVFPKVDPSHRIESKGLRKRAHSANASADADLSLKDAPFKKCRTESCNDQENFSDTIYFESDRQEDQSEVKETSMMEKRNRNDFQKISCLASKSEIDLRVADSENEEWEPENVVNSNSTLALKSHERSTITDSKSDYDSSLISLENSSLTVDNSFQTNESFEDCPSEDDSLTPAVLRNSIYRELDLSSQLPFASPKMSNGNETFNVESCNSQEHPNVTNLREDSLRESPENAVFDSSDEWSICK